ncbi:50S ribosomal protein L34 [endosymbiont GvMRE of Glomus versiforme]|nr:50S ribosomal protein L34 [endosymbiont GvMRE of Glomus versiforme]
MKRTYQPKKKKRKRKHGFLFRMKKSHSIITFRRSKHRWKLTV